MHDFDASIFIAYLNDAEYLNVKTRLGSLAASTVVYLGGS